VDAIDSARTYFDRLVGDFISESAVATNFVDIVVKAVFILQKLVRVFIRLQAALHVTATSR